MSSRVKVVTTTHVRDSKEAGEILKRVTAQRKVIAGAKTLEKILKEISDAELQLAELKAELEGKSSQILGAARRTADGITAEAKVDAKARIDQAKQSAADVMEEATSTLRTCEAGMQEYEADRQALDVRIESYEADRKKLDTRERGLNTRTKTLSLKHSQNQDLVREVARREAAVKEEAQKISEDRTESLRVLESIKAKELEVGGKLKEAAQEFGKGTKLKQEANATFREAQAVAKQASDVKYQNENRDRQLKVDEAAIKAKKGKLKKEENRIKAREERVSLRAEAIRAGKGL